MLVTNCILCITLCYASLTLQCIRKVFKPLDFFHILLRYSLILKCIKSFFSPHQSTPEIPQNDKAKQLFFLRNNDIYINIQTLYSVLCWRTFGSDYRIESSWVWRYKLGTPVFGEFFTFFSADPLKLCQVRWGALLQLYSGLSRDVRLGSSSGSDWATQWHSGSCPEATPALSS